MSAEARITNLTTDNGMIIIQCNDEAGGSFCIRLSLMDVMALSSSLSVMTHDLSGDSKALSRASPSVARFQLEHFAETVALRVFVNDRVYHEYSIPKNTNLARHLDALEASIEREQAEHTTPLLGGGKAH